MSRTAAFFWSVHRSVFDPTFYREVRTQPAARAAWFFVAIIALSSLGIGAAHTWYFMKPSTGFGAQVAVAFQGAEFRGGEFLPPRPTPYVMPPHTFSRALVLAGVMPSVVDFLPESFLVVDTGNAVSPGSETSIHILLSKTSVVLNPHTPYTYTMPYAALVGNRSVSIDEKAVRTLLIRNGAGIFVSFALKDLLLQVMTGAGTLVFLFLAAFILKIDGFRMVADPFAFAVYSSVPVVVGSIIEAAAGTQIKGTWFVFMMISLIVLFRGIRSCLAESRESKSDR
jgi:hypothetical protein